jgi:hypothetical protein
MENRFVSWHYHSMTQIEQLVGYYKVDVVRGAQGINATCGVEVADDVPTGNRLEIAL